MKRSTEMATAWFKTFLLGGLRINFILLFSSQWQILPNKVSEASEVEQIQSHSESILLAFLFK